jgi:DNA polymerase V
MFALVDCNNFFASCEQVFAPHLRNRPLVVLSNNDGCVIARSKEAKALNIPMGAPLFKWRDLIKRHHIEVVSSNFALYVDMSARVVATLEELGYPLEIYSIDESFLSLDAQTEWHTFGTLIHQKVKRWTGLPTCVGIAPTKTLAKVANQRAKREPSLQNVCVFETAEACDPYLKGLPVEEIWGIGRRLAKQLQSYGIGTAYQLKETDDAWIRKKFSVTGLRTVWELRGTSCFDYEPEEEARKSVLKSRSFSRAVTSYEELQEAVSTFAGRCAEKLRKDGLCAGYLSLFISTSRFHPESYYANQSAFALPRRTAYTPEIIAHAKKALKQIFVPGLEYKRAGVILSDLAPAASSQFDLFCRNETKDEKKEELMRAVDQVNRLYGKGSLISAAEGLKKEWLATPQLCSHRYTTSWDELLTIDIDR